MNAPISTLAMAALCCLAALAAPEPVRGQPIVPSPLTGPPVAVSPGGAAGAVIQTRCPTFSWSAAEAAEGYELVLYRVEDDAAGAAEEAGEADVPVARIRLPAGSTTWTPSLEGCLDPGGSYAWSVGAVGEPELVEWSEASLFRVAGTPDADEVEAALETLERYLDEIRAAGEAEADPQDEARPDGSEGARAAGSHRMRRARPLQAAAAGGGTAGEDPEPAESAAASARSEFDFFVQGGAFAGGDVATGGDFRYGSPRSYTQWISPYQFVSAGFAEGLFEYGLSSGYLYPTGATSFFLHAPVELPDGAEMTFVSCFFYDNDPTITNDIHVLRFDLYSRLQTSTETTHLADATGDTLGTGNSNLRSVISGVAPGEGNPVDNNAYAYFLTVQMTPVPGSECTDECRFYGCRIGYTASVLHPAG